MLGIATGLLWAPCAGPVLGPILTGAAPKGAGLGTTLLLFCYAAGAATSLALALLVGGKVFAVMKRSLGLGKWVRRGLGAAVLVGVLAIALWLDTGVLTPSLHGQHGVSGAKLLDRLHPRVDSGSASTTADAGADLPVGGQMPSLDGAIDWVNTKPLTTASLRGKVVLVDFWTYSCTNCLRSRVQQRGVAIEFLDQAFKLTLYRRLDRKDVARFSTS